MNRNRSPSAPDTTVFGTSSSSLVIGLLRSVIIGVIGFLTLVDLFAAQAILPTLVSHYGVSPAAMGFAVNASTMGMAAASVGIAIAGRRIARRMGIWVSLALLAIPTALLAHAPDLSTFTALRLLQGLCMASAFALTMTYLAEHCSAKDTAQALAAYVTGVVASNLIGRLVAASATGWLGLATNFYLFALLNLIGAGLVLANLEGMRMLASEPGEPRSLRAGWLQHFRRPELRAAFGIGFLILFAFIGVFTYVNFVLVAPPLGLPPMMLGLVYLVFLPAMVTTPLAGAMVAGVGARTTIWLGLGIAGVGLPLMLSPRLGLVIAGMALVGVGTFLAQAAATGFVSRVADTNRAAASGLYLASYYLGGLVGAALLGSIFGRYGWSACVAAIAGSLLLAAGLGRLITLR